ncbi:MAG: RluA family pseudouridine synthase [Patescibacteria group bacterium]
MENISYNHENSERLDKFLVNDVGGYSRSQWQKIIKSGFVLVNDERALGKHKLQTGDTVTISQRPEFNGAELPDMDIEVLSKTPDYLVIYKPSGLPVHPDSKHLSNTLVQQLTKKYPELADVDPGSNRSGLVHRLDKDVSGVMVVARTKEMFEHLKAQFQKRTVYKEYLALVHGTLENDEGEFVSTMQRDKKTGKMIVRPHNQEGKKAITKYSVIKRFDHFTYVKIIIETGRTHQIRAVMRSLDHPIVGDTLYMKKKVKANIDISRPFLHAHILSFDNFTQERITTTAELPSELLNIITSLS